MIQRQVNRAADASFKHVKPLPRICRYFKTYGHRSRKSSKGIPYLSNSRGVRVTGAEGTSVARLAESKVALGTEVRL